MRRPLHLLTLVAVTGALLAGCAGRERVSTPEPRPVQQRAALAALGSWEARGRIALKMPGNSGQGSFAWTQAGALTVLRVAGPFGSGSCEIRWDSDRLTVRSSRGEVAADFQGPDAAARFLDEQLGWSMPVANARYWLLGLAGPDSPAVTMTDRSGQLASLEEDGWTVNYDEFRQQGAFDLPRKLVLDSPAGRIRLVIDDWRL